MSGGGCSRGDLPLTELADVDRRLEQCRMRLEEASAYAEAVLRCVEDLPGRTALRDAELLRLRYLRELSGEPLRAALEQDGFPARAQTIYNWQRSAHRNGALALAAMEQARHAERQEHPAAENMGPVFLEK